MSKSKAPITVLETNGVVRGNSCVKKAARIPVNNLPDNPWSEQPQLVYKTELFQCFLTIGERLTYKVGTIAINNLLVRTA